MFFFSLIFIGASEGYFTIDKCTENSLITHSQRFELFWRPVEERIDTLFTEMTTIAYGKPHQMTYRQFCNVYAEKN